MNAREELRKLYEDAMRDAYEEGQAILDKTVEEAEARRRFQVDSQGCTNITYVELGDDDGEQPA
jgi:vacuolar-type H+-ATPase subunit H